MVLITNSDTLGNQSMLPNLHMLDRGYRAPVTNKYTGADIDDPAPSHDLHAPANHNVITDFDPPAIGSTDDATLT